MSGSNYVTSMPYERWNGSTNTAFFEHSSAQRVNTQAVISAALKQEYPKLQQVIVPASNCNLLQYASSTQLATYDKSVAGCWPKPSSLSLTTFKPALRRTDQGTVQEQLLFSRFDYYWQEQRFIVVLADGRDGSGAYPPVDLFYILAEDKHRAEALVHAAGTWTNALHQEVWVYDQGYWQKSKALFEAAQKASWENVILDAGRKKAIIDDHLSFFAARDTYNKLQVPWKRGIIYYGPPGNGKTISIKAMMHTLYDRKDPIPTLYVRSLASYGGPQAAIADIFQKARGMSPCYLILEDLDTIITEGVRSYFLNEVDGLTSNDGIFILGSTNHLDRLDPGIAQRPSRFDRKYFFDNPNNDERVAYCHFWQRKLKDNKEIEFPDKLCGAIAGITKDFSFAYMQEAFVAALLAIARENGKAGERLNTVMPSLPPSPACNSDDGEWLGVSTEDADDGLDKYRLWTEVKQQVAILRKGMLKDPQE